MSLIIGVRFKKPGKVYYFSPAGNTIKHGDHVVVETARGVEYGTVVLAPKQMPDEKIPQPLKPIIRLATEADNNTYAENAALEREAYQICLEKIAKHGLKMKLIDSEYTFDRNKLLFYFTADGRIDFRELVKDLASVFRTRIELRQIGVRDETKMLGGIAICGRPLCCNSYLSDFTPVSIKMAKEQSLSLNPAKISGTCGRLMCCLKNEEEAYEYLNNTLPYIGTKVKTIDGYNGEVQSVSVLKQRVKVLLQHDNDEKEIKEYPVNELQFEKNGKLQKATVSQPLPDEALDELALRELEALDNENLEETAVESAVEPAKPQKQNRRKNRNPRSGSNANNNNNNNNNKNNNNNNNNNNNKNPRPQKQHDTKHSQRRVVTREDLEEYGEYKEYKVSNKEYKKTGKKNYNNQHRSNNSRGNYHGNGKGGYRQGGKQS